MGSAAGTRQRGAETTQTRSRPAVLRGPSAPRLRLSPPFHLGASTGRGTHHHAFKRGPAALADRPEARGFGRRASAEGKPAVFAISEGDTRRQAPRACG
jgi:hypothetical protein